MNVECVPQSPCHISTDSPLPVENQGDCLLRHTKDKSQIALIPPALFHLFLDVKARMHDPIRICCSHIHLTPHSIVIPDAQHSDSVWLAFGIDCEDQPKLVV